jgi:glycosyltransferase involved in cell wall biosynthesis
MDSSVTQDPKILICIPAFNGAGTRADVIKKAELYSSGIIVYDDGSTDNTAEVAKAAVASVIGSRKNKGYGVAISRLFKAATEKKADVIVTLDCDGQHDPHEIPRIIEPILNHGFDIVIGSRFLGDKNEQHQKMPVYRTLGIKTITKFTRSASYSQVTDAQSGFRGYGKNALSKMNMSEEGMGVTTEILLKAKEKEVPISINYTVEKSSTHNPISHGVGVLYSVIQFISLRHPLAFYGLPGIALLIIAILFLNTALRVYAISRPSSLEYIVVFVGFGVVGVVLLATGAILYTITALLKGRIKDL